METPFARPAKRFFSDLQARFQAQPIRTVGEMVILGYFAVSFFRKPQRAAARIVVQGVRSVLVAGLVEQVFRSPGKNPNLK